MLLRARRLCAALRGAVQRPYRIRKLPPASLCRTSVIRPARAKTQAGGVDLVVPGRLQRFRRSVFRRAPGLPVARETGAATGSCTPRQRQIAGGSVARGRFRYRPVSVQPAARSPPQLPYPCQHRTQDGRVPQTRPDGDHLRRPRPARRRVGPAGATTVAPRRMVRPGSQAGPHLVGHQHPKRRARVQKKHAAQNSRGAQHTEDPAGLRSHVSGPRPAWGCAR